MRVILTESRVDYARILEILTQSKPANEADPNYNYYKQLARWAEPGHTQASKGVSLDKANTAIKLSDRSLLDKNPTKLAKRYNNLGSLLTALKTLMDQEGKYNPNNATSQLIQKTTVDVLASLSGLKNQKEPEQSTVKPDNSQKPDPKSTQEPESKVNGRRDWTAEKAKKLANKGNKETSEVLKEFYDEYYRSEYASANNAKDPQEIVNKLKSLDKILIPEFNKLGYNPEVNPFAMFLKNLIKYQYEIFKKLTINTYGAIHNSFISHYITGNMLGKYNTYKDNNILFCSDLYNYKGLDIVNYLLLQNQAINAAKDNSKYSDDKYLVAKMFVQQNSPSNANYDEKVEYLFSIEPGKAIPTTEIITTNANTARLKSALEISEVYQSLFNSAPKKELDNPTADKLRERAEAKDAMLDMVHYLLGLYKLSEETQKEYTSWFKKFNHAVKEDNISFCKKILADYIVNKKSVELLLGKIKARIEFQRKEAKS
jgi:hypothetical protein